KTAVQILHPVPVASGHKEGVTVLQKTFYPFNTVKRRKLVQIRVRNVKILHGIGCKRHFIKPSFPFILKEKYMFAAIKMRVENVREIYIVMKKGYRTFAAKEHIGVFVQETSHQIFRRYIVLL